MERAGERVILFALLYSVLHIPSRYIPAKILIHIFSPLLMHFRCSCLLLAQDREEIYVVIGEWDSLYEQYALEGKFSETNLEKLKQLRATRDAAALDAGFLTLHVYGPFGGFERGISTRRDSMKTLSANLLALSLHLSQASCSPSSRRPSPPASIQLPTQRGGPCCPDCTCRCRCKPLPGSRGASKPQSETSDTGGGGRRQGSREGSSSRDPSTKSTASHSSHESGVRQGTPTRDPRPPAVTRRPDEIRAALARDQQGPGPVQAQGHHTLPLRERRTASDLQGGRSVSQSQASQSSSRARDAAAAGRQGQAQAPAGLSRPPPLPQPPRGSTIVPGEQRQPQQGQRDPSEQPGKVTQQPRDPRRVLTGSATQHQDDPRHTQPQAQRRQPQVPGQTVGKVQQPQHVSSAGAGPSYQTPARPSPSRPPVLDLGGPSRPQQNPEETPTKDDKKSRNPLSPKNWLSIGRKGKGKDKKKGPEDEHSKK